MSSGLGDVFEDIFEGVLLWNVFSWEAGVFVWGCVGTLW